MVTQSDKAERGVGLQNFAYAPAWEELCHIIQIHSPRAYEALREYLPMPTRRNLRTKEAHQPQFPMTICDRTFELVADHLQKIGYNGPVGLSCDDTKLFATFRLYWDSDVEEYFLVGATDGPIKVLEPESVRWAIENAKAQKATKVRLFEIFRQCNIDFVYIDSALGSINSDTQSRSSHCCRPSNPLIRCGCPSSFAYEDR
jgi:hypothetical protein